MRDKVLVEVILHQENQTDQELQQNAQEVNILQSTIE